MASISKSHRFLRRLTRYNWESHNTLQRCHTGHWPSRFTRLRDQSQLHALIGQRREEVGHHFLGVIGLSTNSELISPLSSRIKRVPPTALAIPPTTTWIVIAKAFQTQVPNWLVVIYQETLGQRDPNGNYDQISAREVEHIKVSNLSNGPSMLSDSASQCWLAYIYVLPFARSWRNSFAHIYR